MWFLRADLLIRLLAASAALAAFGTLARRFLRPGLFPWALLLADAAVLLYVSPALAGFYAGYTLCTFALARWVCAAKRGRRGVFVLSCLLCAAPFFYARALALGAALPPAPVIAGFSYNMLKAVDAMYFAYYAGSPPPLLPYANFILFFPSFTGGPVFRWRDFAASLARPEPVTAAGTERCVKRLIRGLFKKLVLVTLLGTAFQSLLARPAALPVSLGLIVLGYLLLYCDLSGYSDVAIAVGGMTGIRMPENFKNPLSAATFTQFWRKWHVSLSDWIREHIYVVVRGKKLTRAGSAAIAFCTMAAMSLWHGFTPAMVASGVYLGTLLALENLAGRTTADRRRTPRGVFYLRCAAVNLLFAVNALLFFLTPRQVLTVLAGLLRL